jgi:hypothetical protein
MKIDQRSFVRKAGYGCHIHEKCPSELPFNIPETEANSMPDSWEMDVG